jgi:hypothetical protein
MYALPRVAAFVSGERLLKEMVALLGRERIKVTVLKEALRLVGGVGGEEAARVVAQVWRREGLHRDGRIAALHAARSTPAALDAFWSAPDADRVVGVALVDVAATVDVAHAAGCQAGVAGHDCADGVDLERGVGSGGGREGDEGSRARARRRCRQRRCGGRGGRVPLRRARRPQERARGRHPRPAMAYQNKRLRASVCLIADGDERPIARSR